jgi:hypothetical protein
MNAHLPKDRRGKVAPKPHPGCGQTWIDHQDLKWESDWDGEEVGHPDIPVVGLWKWRDTEVYMYVNAETLEIIEIWESREEE